MPTAHYCKQRFDNLNRQNEILISLVARTYTGCIKNVPNKKSLSN